MIAIKRNNLKAPTMSMYWTAFLVALLAGVALMQTQRGYGRLSLGGTQGVRKFDTTQTPQIGGIAVALGLAVAWAPAKPQAQAISEAMLMVGISAFVFGLAEYVTKKVGGLPFLLATMFSGALAWWLNGVAMQNTGFAPLDWSLQFLPFAVLFTDFPVGGVANAVNIIDGFNDLASGAVAFKAGEIGLIALNMNDPALAACTFVLIACTLSFGAINWPIGKTFLGNGGVYLLGFALACLAMLLTMRQPSITAWATILVCIYSVVKIGFSVRLSRKGARQADQSDKEQFHHFLLCLVERKLFPAITKRLQNGLTSPLCWLCTSLPAVLAAVFVQNTLALAVCFTVLTFAYGDHYARLTHFLLCFSGLTMTAPREPTRTDQALCMNNLQTIRLAIIGLVYASLPLAVAFGKQLSVLGFDINGKKTQTSPIAPWLKGLVWVSGLNDCLIALKKAS